MRRIEAALGFPGAALLCKSSPMKRVAAIILTWAMLTWPAFAQLGAQKNVEIALHSARAAIAPGERFTVVLRQNIRDGWHTYWINPGAAGEPTEIEWRLPAGWSAGPIQWPTPHAIPFESLVNYGYESEVLLPVELTAPASLRPGQSITLNADATWVACADICVFEEGEAALTLAVAAQGRDDPRWGPRIAQALAALPTPFSAEGPLQARVSAGDPPRLSIALPGETLRDPYFFPYSRDALDPSKSQNASFGSAGVSFDLPGGADKQIARKRLDGVLTFTDAAGAERAYEVFAEPGAPLPSTSGARALDAPALDAVALIGLIAFAFLGGLILNIMPCVLPVLSVKALSFAGGAHAGEARRHGLLYFAGVMATFLGLAALLIALRGAGAAIGWGFQLQAPWMNAGLALLFFVIGLNLLGVFHFGGGLQNAGGALARRGGDAGAFFTGALAVIAATPCTAPFMAGAIGAALTQSAGVTLLIFAALALGFALPMTALSFAPALQRMIPRPGAWMERAKQVLAFPMFGAAVWLAWVLTEQTGAAGVMALLSIAAALAFVLFVSRWGRAWLAAGLVALALTTALTWRPLLGVANESAIAWETWSPARVEALRAEGRPVFVNFTAAWCVTCKVNEGGALASARVRRALDQAKVAMLQADWTNRDETIATTLAAHGRAGVPLYLFYPADGGAALVLPQILSEDLVIQTVAGERP
jgi:thiol:disulfide interchange protein/DsbC/DsbD-like thiol-disulfide interchange protein